MSVPAPETNDASPTETPTPVRARSSGWKWLFVFAALLAVGAGGAILAVGGIEPLKDLIAPALVEVTGTATFKGEPLKAGFVQTYYERAGFMGALGAIEPDGSFKLKTNGDPGVFTGKHRVIVMWMDNNFPPRSLLPDKYTQPQTTPFVMQVSRQGSNVWKLDLKEEP